MCFIIVLQEKDQRSNRRDEQHIGHAQRRHGEERREEAEIAQHSHPHEQRACAEEEAALSRLLWMGHSGAVSLQV